MKLHSITYNAYKLFKQATLKASDGLFYIGGVNMDVAGASSNMAGKSSLAEGLVYALYGTDLSGKPVGASIIREGEQCCSVTAMFVMDNGHHFSVQRCRTNKPAAGASMTTVVLIETDTQSMGVEHISGAAADYQKYIDARFGTCDLFLAAHIFAFNTTSIPFAESTDKEQKRLFNLLINAGDLDAALQRAKDTRQRLQADKCACEAALVGLESKADTIRTLLSEDVSADIVDATNECVTLKHDLAVATAAVHSLDADYAIACNKVNAYVNELNVQREHHANLIAIKRNGIADLSATVSFFDDAIQLLKDSQAATCPTCNAPMNDAKRNELIDSYQKQILGLSKQIAELRAEISDNTDKMRKVDSNISSEQAKISSAGVTVTNAKSDYALVKSKLQASMSVRDSLKAKQNADLKKLQDSFAETTFKINEERKDITKIDHALSIYTFWEAAFGQKGIRSYRLDMITPVLNTFAAKYSNILFGDGTVLRYSTQTKAKKSGEYRDKFEVALYKQVGKSCTKIATSLSAGQSMRRDIIHAFAMMELAYSLGKRTVDIVILDELFVTIDEKGISAVIAALDELTAIAGIIWVIEHNADLFAYFANAIFVKRAGNVSTIQE